MSSTVLAFGGIGLMLVTIFLRIPVAAAMGFTGFIGTWVMLGSPNAPLSQLKTLTFDTFSNYSLSIVPLFLLMGQFATKSGMSRALFASASDWLGHFRGGVAMASVGASAGFGAICGSSLATASTMGQVALPEMKRRGFSDSLSTGVLAAGGTLGILIPPSIVLVIYAILAEQNIANLFMAGLIPGILAAVGYMITVRLYVFFRPTAATGAPKTTWAQKINGLWHASPVALIFALVMGGVAADWNWSRSGIQALFTPTEGAAIGAILTGLYGWFQGGLRLPELKESILETAESTGMIFLILLGAQLFNSFLALTQAPQMIGAWVEAAGLPALVVLLAMLCVYLIFGCVMDSLSMILLTMPVFFPIVEALDFGMGPTETALWFGILALSAVEIGLITPPIGLNLFIIGNVDREIPMHKIYRGVMPFVLSDLVRIAILISIPAITLWLPSKFF
ncbi:MAG: TRAP transporter large permease [Halocynthiibacter sp.]